MVGLIAAFSGSAIACAAIWGFQDPIDRVGDDAAAEAGADGAHDAATDALVGPETVSEGGCTAACIPAVPTNWGGPYTIFESTGGPPPPAAPSCASPFGVMAYDGNASLSAAAAECHCACDPPTGLTCTTPIALTYSDGMCNMACGPISVMVATGCTPLEGACPGGYHVLVTKSSPTGGSCAPRATKNLPAADWKDRVRLCGLAAAPPAAGCGTGEICAPTASLPFEPSTYCVVRTGDVDCPNGYSHKRTYYAGTEDTRDCAPCTCDAPLGAQCTGGNLQLYMDPGCTMPGVQVPVPAMCGDPKTGKSAIFEPPTPTGGGCDASAPTATGGVMPTTSTTICCTQ
jgi:hypothetical protein